MIPHLCIKYVEKPWGVLPEKLGEGVRHPSWNSYPISEQNLWFSLPYFRPEAQEPGAWPERVRDKLLLHEQGWRKNYREVVLSPNDKEVASSKKHTQFTYPISDQKG